MQENLLEFINRQIQNGSNVYKFVGGILGSRDVFGVLANELANASLETILMDVDKYAGALDDLALDIDSNQAAGKAVFLKLYSRQLDEQLYNMLMNWKGGQRKPAQEGSKVVYKSPLFLVCQIEDEYPKNYELSRLLDFKYIIMDK